MRLPIFCAKQCQFNVSSRLYIRYKQSNESESVLTAITACNSGFRTRFQPEIELLPVADHLFYHGTHLIHFNGIDNKVLCLYTRTRRLPV